MSQNLSSAAVVIGVLRVKVDARIAFWRNFTSSLVERSKYKALEILNLYKTSVMFVRHMQDPDQGLSTVVLI